MQTYLDATETIDTVDNLCAKIDALGSINKETLLDILAQKDDEAVARYDHELQCNLTQKKISKVHGYKKPWTLRTRKTIKSVSSRLASWRYSGEIIQIPSIFEEEYDFSQLMNFTDLVQVNDLLINIGKKCSKNCTDGPETKKGLRCILTNLENMQVAIGELHMLTFTTENTLSSSEQLKIKSSMDTIVTEFQKISNKMTKKCVLSIQAKQLDTLETQLEKEIPNVDDCENLSCTSALLIENSVVNVIRKFELDHILYLASGSDDGILRLWNMHEKNLEKTLLGHTGKISALIFYEHDRTPFLASGSDESEIMLWDLNSKESVKTLQERNYVSDLTTFKIKDQFYLASISKHLDTITLWDLDKVDLHEILKLPYDDGKIGNNAIESYHRQGILYLIIGSNDQTIKILDVVKKSVIAKLFSPEPSGQIISLCPFTYEGIPMLASGSSYVHLWDLEDYCLIKGAPHVGNVTSMDLVRCDDDLCLVTASTNGNMKIYSLDLTLVRGLYAIQRSCVTSISVFECCERVCFAAGGIDCTIKLWID